MQAFFLLISIIFVLPIFSLEHEFPGCPPNSRCTPALGKQYLNFLSYLGAKKKIPATTPIPIKAWWHQDPSVIDSVIWWQGECALHRQQNIYLAEVLATATLKNLPSGVFVGKLWQLNTQGKIKVYPLPRRESPIAFHRDRLIILTNFDRNYLQVAIQENGKISFPGRDLYRPTKNVSCPSPLIAAYKQDVAFASLFPHYYCEEIWDHTNKQIVVVILAHDCR